MFSEPSSLPSFRMLFLGHDTIATLLYCRTRLVIQHHITHYPQHSLHPSVLEILVTPLYITVLEVRYPLNQATCFSGYMVRYRY